MPLKIIKADTSYTAAITSIGKKSFRETFGHLFSSREYLFEYLEYTYNPVKIAKSIRKENNVYFVAMLEDMPVGFVKVKMNSLHSQIESIAQMELQKIYVLPEHHGAGAGTALLNAALKLAREVCPDYLWLDTHTSNSKAIRFYEKNGFRKAGNHYFTIGTQTFEYYLMTLHVAINEPCHC
ncbi:MAG TPA: GNAT family N-acetyltransferase [Chitinophagaceae bacterium]|nr:GNAT family N-acetyltransferase [Chitinophagaceae bacterium]